MKVVPQDAITGARGNQRGHIVGRIVANYLGVRLFEIGKNEGTYLGKNVVIKYAGLKTTKYGITHDMWERIDKVILAKAFSTDGRLSIFLVNKIDVGIGTSSHSRGSRGHTTMFRVNVAVQKGEKIGELLIKDLLR